jgi:hypothetical protein
MPDSHPRRDELRESPYTVPSYIPRRDELRESPYSAPYQGLAELVPPGGNGCKPPALH